MTDKELVQGIQSGNREALEINIIVISTASAATIQVMKPIPMI